ncbi:MAG: colanic acid biosynthesis glycosyltransferase WcaL [Rhizobiales bacterium NRL2]|jgi:glycosyltransferase involved in cell wall biosynthesis|nr:MAG: colanic acid biosynthesis glycosyltransferase WcaL [Rhizobiales bacterium NRL2]
MAGRTAFILKGYPRLSETFIAQEIRALERRGLAIDIWSLRHPTDQAVHPVHDEIKAPVAYLPEYLRDEPERVRRAIAACRGLPAYGQVLKLWERDFARDPTTNRVRRLGQAFVMAAELPPDVAWLHAHFLHTPASVARYAALLRGLPWSVSAHAKDIWTSPEWEKREKLADCAWAVTCTAVNADHLAALAPAGRVELVYHGLDLDRFPPPSAPAKAAPPVILSVGRAVPKKGYGDLLEALARVRAPFRFVHIGGGGEIGKLKARAAELGLADRVEWRGPQPQSAVLAACREASLFALASRVTEDGDRDGLPNVIVEAQSQQLPVVATAVSAIPELIRDGENGRLAAEGDVAGLAAAIEELLADPGRAERMGRRGEEIVRRDFDLDRCIGRLAQRFGLAAA